MRTPDPPVYQAPQPDPLLEQQRAQAQEDSINALQDKLKGDTASTLSRYGALLSLVGK